MTGCAAEPSDTSSASSLWPGFRLRDWEPEPLSSDPLLGPEPCRWTWTRSAVKVSVVNHDEEWRSCTGKHLSALSGPGSAPPAGAQSLTEVEGLKDFPEDICVVVSHVSGAWAAASFHSDLLLGPELLPPSAFLPSVALNLERLICVGHSSGKPSRFLLHHFLWKQVFQQSCPDFLKHLRGQTLMQMSESV